MRHKHIEIANKFTGMLCTINGEKAKVCGRLNGFATVASLESGLHAEFAWQTVEKIMLTHKKFKA